MPRPSDPVDEFKCIGCGKCAEVCPSGIIYDPEHPETVPAHAPVEKTCDLVVLGAGGSGLVAAVRAAQLSGKKVIVVEKSKKIGGNTNLGHGFMMRYTKWHEAAGLEDTREESINSLPVAPVVLLLRRKKKTRRIKKKKKHPRVAACPLQAPLAP